MIKQLNGTNGGTGGIAGVLVGRKRGPGDLGGHRAWISTKPPASPRSALWREFRYVSSLAQRVGPNKSAHVAGQKHANYGA
jgi:hypothetical protein